MGHLGAGQCAREHRYARCAGDSDPRVRVRGLVPVSLLLKTNDHHLAQGTHLFPFTAPRGGRAARDCKEASAGTAAEGSQHVILCFHITIFLCERALREQPFHANSYFAALRI
jgi:hypothetical protein